ncbi:hypothetical protein ACVWYO_000053 [Sphingomonas sp. UYP23]
MGRYDPSKSLLAGMDTTILRQRLAQMQQDYLDISSGRKVESAGYAQGDGSKTVKYTAANLDQLSTVIRQLQAQLGIIPSPRRAIGFRF